jgi:hypothetical protein
MKKKIILIAIMVHIIITMAGCGCNSNTEVIQNDGRSITAINISATETLVYDTNTRIVYIEQYTYSGNYIYTPYLSENGLYYRFIDGELVEVVIIPEEENEE